MKTFIFGIVSGAIAVSVYSALNEVYDESIKVAEPVRIEPNQQLPQEELQAVVSPLKIKEPAIKDTLYRTNKKMYASNQDFDCLARNIYFEASVESQEGMIAVAEVTANRLATSEWGDSFCKVVYAPNQFSWTANKSKRKQKLKGPLWEASKDAARKFLYHTGRSSPGEAKGADRTVGCVTPGDISVDP